MHSHIDFLKLFSLQRIDVFAIIKICKNMHKIINTLHHSHPFLFPALLLTLSHTLISFKILCSHWPQWLDHALYNSLTSFLIFHYWQLSVSTTFPSPSAPYLGKLIREPGHFLLWHLWEIQTTQTLTCVWET